MTEQIRQIKQDLRTMMNGVAAASMREAGLTTDYRVSFGVELPRLQDYARQLQPAGAALATALWKESVRECRLLALMLYPAEQMDGELADVWVESIHSAELAQMASMLLFSRIKGASHKAFEWIAAESEMLQTVGYYTLGRIIRQSELNERSQKELRDQAATAIASSNPVLRLAAQRTINILDTTD